MDNHIRLAIRQTDPNSQIALRDYNNNNPTTENKVITVTNVAITP